MAFIKSLIDDLDQGKQLKYLMFWGHKNKQAGVSKACFSQWYVSPFTDQGLVYPTAEHYMMAEKARLFNDHAVAEQILNTPDPGKAKHLGRRVKAFDETVWQQQRFNIVVKGNTLKYQQHEELQNYLLATEPKILVEASPLDRVWGIGLATDDERAQDPRQWQGLNLLGFALMAVRATLSIRIT